ncbi:MAG: GGDEF domain-containing protein [Propionibacteriales bacterium]|nr:GGDEF domain-containing protein [Propionibacteriales bacterium]
MWHVCGAVAVFVESLVLAVTAATSSPPGTATPVVLLAAPPLAALALMVGLRFGCWRRRSTLLVWPAAVCVVYGLVGVDAPEAARLVPGLVSMAFVFAGLTQPPWRSLWLLGPAVPAFVVAWGGFEGPVLQRTTATAVMWVIVSELPARLITHLNEQRVELERLARTDPLTGVLNRRDLACRLDASSGRSTLAVIDVDGFKRFNDTHGHVAGDDLLRRLGALLACSVHGSGDVFRTGGDEFVLVLDEDEASARRRLEELRRWWAATEQVTLSMGVAPGGPDGLRHADLDMYGDKRLRRAAEQVTESPPESPHGRTTVDPSEAEGSPS